MGTPIQGPSKADYRRAALQSTQKTFMQIYEDTPLPVKSHISPEDMIQIEYTRITHFDGKTLILLLLTYESTWFLLDSVGSLYLYSD